MAELEEIWLPLVDEPIGSIVEQIQQEHPEIQRLVGSPRRVLAFRTFAYSRVGLVRGQLLFVNDFPPYDRSESWVDVLLKDPVHHQAIADEVRAVAQEVADDPAFADEEPLGPDEDAKERFRAFVRQQLT